MSALEKCDDPWQTPSNQLDAELLETSQRLMAKSDAQFSQSESPTIHPELEVARQKITELELQKQRIFQRNVSLTAEAAQLRATNQRLTQELKQYEQQTRKSPQWLSWLFSR